MKISLNWIKSLIPGLEIDSCDNLFGKMVEIGLDIESIEFEKEKYRNFLVGEVLETKKHPGADKLTVCRVNTGTAELNIVCGAPNVSAGQKVCVALIGAIIPKGNFEIKKSRIRGEISEGMICAEDELGISDDHEGIMVLKDDAQIGSEFAEYIGADDVLIEIGVTPNRGDLFSQTGIAREIASVYGLKVSLPVIDLKESEDKCTDHIDIGIKSTEFCKRFTGRIIRNITVKESPEWLKKSLISVGLRPINNIVDVTNFVMMETGQPLHAFDYDKIKKKQIIIRTASEGEKFITLDSKERILNENSLMVCDGVEPVAIAGIMGGEQSEITDETKNILLEVAYFDPVSIRKNSKKLGLQTDASQRFERGVDIGNIPYVSGRAASLIQKLTGGEVLKGIADVYPEKIPVQTAGIRQDRCSKVIGKEFSAELIISLLEKIDFRYTGTADGFINFDVPYFRAHDVTREADLIEEVARLYGYSNIENDYSVKLSNANLPDYGDEKIRLKNEIRNYFIGRGFNEIISYTQQDKDNLGIFSEKPVVISNPNSSVMNSMRVNLAYGLMSVLFNNQNALGRNISLKIFETGKVFEDKNGKFHEADRIAFTLYGHNDMNSFNSPETDFEYFDCKGEIEMFLSKLNIENYVLIYYNDIENFTGFFEIRVKNELIGKIYLFGKHFPAEMNLEYDVYIAEFDVDALMKHYVNGKFFRGISKFPPVKRDLAFVARKDVKYSDIKDVIALSAGKLLKTLSLFDVYEGDKLGQDKKSYAFSLEFGSEEKTLTDEDVSKLTEKIVKSLNNKLGLTIREN
ncbi:MAG: phenylalanine--tRNA ligase subunit beta [Ignavibacteria bacterium]|nr:phenylalanine--tRNA ligase subunit beta [Ignavibacteria bacterium]